MATTMKTLGIDRLSPEQRIDLALEIWESLEEPRSPARLTAEQRVELAPGQNLEPELAQPPRQERFQPWSAPQPWQSHQSPR